VTLTEGLARGENRAKIALAAVESRLKDALAVAGTSIESLESPMTAPLAEATTAFVIPLHREYVGNWCDGSETR
jgi:hypothetical protein